MIWCCTVDKSFGVAGSGIPLSWQYNSLMISCTGSLFQSVLKDELVWAAVGCHPKNATDFDDLAEYKMRQMLKHKRIVALGEIGLDYSGT